jgi:hypothetical protein
MLAFLKEAPSCFEILGPFLGAFGDLCFGQADTNSSNATALRIVVPVIRGPVRTPGSASARLLRVCLFASGSR